MAETITNREDTQPPSAAQRTRIVIMQAAERLFADVGLDAVSLRAICAASGQRNISSVQYHFGSKEHLLQAIMEFREQEMEMSRQRLLEDAAHCDESDYCKALLRAIFEPYALPYLANGDVDFIRLIASYLNHVRPRGQVPHPADYADESFPHLHEAMIRLRARLHRLDEVRFRQRVDSIGALFYGAFIQHASRDDATRMDKTQLLEDTLDMMAAAIQSTVAT